MGSNQRSDYLEFILTLSCLGLSPALFAGVASPVPIEGPNVIYVMTDDQGLGDFSSLGNPVLETPRLDQLGAESTRLASFYVHPVCTPTRAALMTGRHPQRTQAIDTYIGRAMLEPEEVTIAEVLKDAGWRTGIFGKWHLGDCAPMRPLDQGFERALVHKGGGIGQPSDPLGAEGKYTDPVLMDQGVERSFDGYCTDIYFDEAMKWMGEKSAAGERFFCYIAPNAPHTPLHDVPQALYEKYKAKDLSAKVFTGGLGNPVAEIDQDKLARLYAMIENIDQNMGRLVDFLEEGELAEDTLLVFLCDNGPQGHRFVKGLRGSKGEVYEGGVRSPLFVRWPGKLKPGEISDDFGAHLDLFPTVLEACGVAQPEGLELDGYSLLPLLKREEGLSPRPALVMQWNRGAAPVEGQNCFVRLGKWKLVNYVNAGSRSEPPRWDPEVFDLDKDPYEQADYSTVAPKQAEQLGAIYQLWFMDVAEEIPNRSLSRTPIQIGGEGARRVVLTRQDWTRNQGGGWGKNGYWKVLFAEDEAEESEPWKVRVLFPRGVTPKHVKLGINSGVWTYVTYDGEIKEGAREVTIEGVYGIWFPGKPATIDCRLIGVDGVELGPHQVIFSR
jgi:arylsulfatase A-like enzyme